MKRRVHLCRIKEIGVRWTDTALAEITRCASGDPSAVQLIASAASRHRSGETIGASHVVVERRGPHLLASH